MQTRTGAILVTGNRPDCPGFMGLMMDFGLGVSAGQKSSSRPEDSGDAACTSSNSPQAQLAAPGAVGKLPDVSLSG